MATSDSAAHGIVMRALPEIELIADRRLRAAVRDIWAKAWMSSTWPELDDCPKGRDLPGHSLVTHSRTVARLALGMRDVLVAQNGVTIDRDEVLAIALLHDVSKLHEFERAGDTVRSSELGRKTQHGFYAAFWMQEAGLPLDMVHAVIAHTNLSSTVPQTQAAVLVHYADFADSDSLLMEAGLPLFCKRR
jgi:putative nucleotidyltransferase with HDIG domain